MLPAGINLPVIIWHTRIEVTHLKSKPYRYPQQADNIACINSTAKLECAGVGSRLERSAASGRRFAEARVSSTEGQPGNNLPAWTQFHPHMRGEKHVGILGTHALRGPTHFDVKGRSQKIHAPVYRQSLGSC